MCFVLSCLDSFFYQYLRPSGCFNFSCMEHSYFVAKSLLNTSTTVLRSDAASTITDYLKCDEDSQINLAHHIQAILLDNIKHPTLRDVEKALYPMLYFDTGLENSRPQLISNKFSPASLKNQNVLIWESIIVGSVRWPSATRTRWIKDGLTNLFVNIIVDPAIITRTITWAGSRSKPLHIENYAIIANVLSSLPHSCRMQLCQHLHNSTEDDPLILLHN